MVRALLLSLVLVSSFVPRAHAQIFWELDGDVQGPIAGDATFPGEENRIEVTSFSFGMSSTGTNGGTSTPQINVTSVSLSKAWDSASINLAAAVGTSERLSTCILRIYSSGAPAPSADDGSLERRMPMPWELEITLLGARVEAHTTAGDAVGGPIESVSLVFEEIRLLHGPTADSFSWNLIGLPRSAPNALSTGLRNDTDDPFTFAAPPQGTWRIDVADPTGRIVRSLVAPSVADGSGAIVWDGTNDFGRRVAPGVYVATQRLDDREITRRIVIGN